MHVKEEASDGDAAPQLITMYDQPVRTRQYASRKAGVSRRGGDASSVQRNNVTDSYKRVSPDSSGVSQQVAMPLNVPGANHPGPVYMHVNTLDAGSNHQLPLFQAQWLSGNVGDRSGDLGRPNTGRTPARDVHSSSPEPVVKRPLSPTGSDAPAKKHARLTGFAARMTGTSAYRGVSWHTQTSRWKAQIKVLGKDVNLGRHRDEVEAARAYDRAAICARGEKDAKLNFSIEEYAHEIPTLTATPLAELAATLRGVEQRLQAQTSRYHGVRLNKRTQKWEAYIRVAGKHVHLGCYDSEVAAAQAFDQAALVRQAHNLGAMGGKPQLVTNFPPMIYLEFTNQLFQLANPLINRSNVTFNQGPSQGAFCRLEDKYVQNLLQKCREQGGSLTAFPSIVSS